MNDLQVLGCSIGCIILGLEYGYLICTFNIRRKFDKGMNTFETKKYRYTREKKNIA